MQKMILVVTVLLLMTSANINAHAQGTEKKEGEKTTTLDAWRQAIPEGEQNPNSQPVVVIEESKDNVEAEETAAQTEKRILELERRLMEAFKQRDSIALKQLLAKDFVPAGASVTESKSERINYVDWAQKNLELKSYSVEKISVRVYDTTAITTIHYNRQATVGGSPSNGDFIATNVWVKRGKRWQAVSHHVSQLSKP
jgi:hypothetical protein